MFVIFLLCYFSASLVIPKISCHNKLVSELGYLFYGMDTAKYEVEKFDGQNSFSYDDSRCGLCYDNKV
jgi:hypothetical protein